MGRRKVMKTRGRPMTEAEKGMIAAIFAIIATTVPLAAVALFNWVQDSNPMTQLQCPTFTRAKAKNALSFAD